MLSHAPGEHIHPVLRILIEGQEVTIPADIGITPTRHFQPHTHDTTGTLHVGEGATTGIDPPGSPVRLTTLKDFFDVWRTTGQPGTPQNNPNALFSSTQVLDKVQDATHQVSLTVNGQPNSQFELYSPHDGDQVLISYEQTIPANRPPTANAQTAVAAAQTVLPVTLSGDDGDPDLIQALFFRVQTLPASGVLRDSNGAVVTAGATLPSANVSYTPGGAFTGNDSFTFVVVDDGGTANGGQDTSQPATVSLIVVSGESPTNLALAEESDTGVFHDDNLTDDFTPTLTVLAQPGVTVRFQAHGSSVVASETSPGQYTATLPQGSLQLGANSITASVQAGSTTSPPSAPLEVVFAPSFENLYVVPGTPGASQGMLFRWTTRLAGFDNEVGSYVVDDPTGRIGTVAPGDPGYARAVMSSPTRQVLFSSGQGSGASRELLLAGGQILGFYIVQDSTSQAHAATNPDNSPAGGPLAFFSFTAANPDGISHLRVVADPHTGRAEYHWEDLTGGGDRDFNDVVMVVSRRDEPAVQPAAAIRVPGGGSRPVDVTFNLLPAVKAHDTQPNQEPIEAEVGLFLVDDSSGQLGGVGAQDALYAAAALGSATRQTIFSVGETPGSRSNLRLPAGALLGLYVVVGGTSDDFLDGDATNLPTSDPLVLFSFGAANPDEQEHFRAFQPERVALEAAGTQSSALRLHVMDKLFGSDDDFDDLLFTLEFVS